MRTNGSEAAEANFQVLEDRLDASAKLEISNHLHQTDWVDLELSNQISDLCNDCIVSKRGRFRLTSGLAPGGSGGRSGTVPYGHQRRKRRRSGEATAEFWPRAQPIFYCSVVVICYFTYQWGKAKIRKELVHLLLECQQAQKEQEQELASPTAQGQHLAV